MVTDRADAALVEDYDRIRGDIEAVNAQVRRCNPAHRHPDGFANTATEEGAGRRRRAKQFSLPVRAC